MYGGWLQVLVGKQLKGEAFFFEVVFVCADSIILLPAVPTSTASHGRVEPNSRQEQ